MYRTWTSQNKFTYIKAITKRNNNSITKSLQLREEDKTSCPIKPSKNIIPKDLNLQKIFTNMLKSSQDLIKNYSFSTLDNSCNDLCSSTNKHLRNEIFRKIREFFVFFKIEYKIFFKTILLYDFISIENEKKKLLFSSEEIALGALILSIKFNYDENKMFSMKKFLTFYGEQKYSLSDIFNIERKTLKVINYYLNFTTPMCFLEFFLLNGIIYNTDNISQKDYCRIYNQVEKTLENIMEDSNHYLKYNFFYLACSVVCYCRKMFYLENWPKMLKKVFSVEFNFFKKEYNFFFNKSEENNNQANNNYCNIINENKVYNPKTYNINNNVRKDIIINGNNNIFLLDLHNLNDNSYNNISKRNNYYNNSHKINYF